MKDLPVHAAGNRHTSSMKTSAEWVPLETAICLLYIYMLFVTSSSAKGFSKMTNRNHLVGGFQKALQIAYYDLFIHMAHGMVHSVSVFDFLLTDHSSLERNRPRKKGKKTYF